MRRLLLAAAAAAALSACATANAPRATAQPALPQAQDSYFKAGAARVAARNVPGRAKNVILFVGDGMGVTTVTTARIYAGQSKGVDGESYTLTMDTAAHLALSRTYGHDAQISDSAPTATALMSGVKTNEAVIGLTSAQPRGKCEGWQANVSESIFSMAEDAGLATGVVSTARITHATPAAAYAHVGFRDWENDVNAARSGGAGCVDIARQLVEWPKGDGLELALGGGRANFLPSTMADPEDAGATGARADGKDLTAAWRAKSPAHVFVWNTQQLADAPAGSKILGLFSRDHMAYESARGPANEPSLAELTAAAIRRLSASGKGYVLLVEGGRIDHAHHDGRAGEALNETIAYDNAIRAALDLTSREDTLVIATADHSHTLTMSGYAQRGNPILGLSADDRGVARAMDGKPYTTLGYANGPGAVMPPAPQPTAEAPAATRPDLSAVDTKAIGFRQQSLVPLYSETHGGEDVAIYAWGAGAANVAGTMEQNEVFHVMARALGFSPR
jgi:alkaline phosphatase